MYAPQEIAVYIHWPFCKSKCPYCDFYSRVSSRIPEDAIVAEYLNALEQYHRLTSERKVRSIFFGGGTPSLMKPQNIERIIDFICRKWPINSEAEISLEANPNSYYKQMFSDLKAAGINRLSLGVQALNENDLRFLGRTHSLEQARLCLQEVVKVFDNHSADLIYARPKQNFQQWQNELQEICSYGLRHLSLYQLTIEKNTLFARRHITPLDDEQAVLMYHETVDYLRSHQYNLYEISNFAQSGYESKHNLTYWHGEDYIGIGPTAHGRLFHNGRHLALEYPDKQEVLSAEEKAEELIIMGLRLSEGINFADFKQICGLSFFEFINRENFENLRKLGLITADNMNVKATRQGQVLLNQIVLELCS